MPYPDTDSWVVQSFVGGEGLSSSDRPAVPAATLPDTDCVPLIVEDMLDQRTVADACRAAADRIQQHFGVAVVAVGLTRAGRAPCRLAGLSQLESFDGRSPWIRAIESALDEAAMRARLGVWPATDADDRHGLLAHQGFCRVTGTEWVVSVPITRGGEHGVAVLLVAGQASGRGSRAVVDFAAQAGGRLGGCFQTILDARQGIVSRCVARLRAMFGQRRTMVMLAALALVAVSMGFPVPYRIKCDAELQPVIRRFVAAPFDGTLETSLVAPGDLVARDQVLARMDEREIRWELSSLRFELNRADKERDAALANHMVGAAQLATLEMQRLQVRIEMLENRVRHLDVASPLAGIVVAGDLEKAQGAPLTVGQTLFEIAPLDSMIVEIAVPEREISFVAAGMPVSLRLDAFGRQTFEGRVARIHPRSELREDESIFVADFELTNPEGGFRPGMNGQATLTADARPLGWNLFHRAWESLLEKLGW